MTILLLILKIIGITLLSILGLVLLLVLLLLYAPFWYKVNGVYNEDTIQANASVRWLFIKALVEFEKKSGVLIRAKVIGITVFKKQIPIGKKKKSEDEFTDEDFLEADALEEALAEEAAKEEAAEAAGKAESDKTEEKEEKTDAGEKTDTEEKPNAEEKTDTEEKPNAEEKTDAEADALDEPAEEKKSLEDKLEAILDKVNSSIEKVQTKVDHVEQFLDQDFVQKTISNALKLLKKVLMSIRPRKGDVDLVLGLKSSAETGLLLAKMAPFYPFFGRWLHMTPDFYNKRVDAKGYIKGRIILGVIGFPILFFLIKRSTRRTIALAKKI